MSDDLGAVLRELRAVNESVGEVRSGIGRLEARGEEQGKHIAAVSLKADNHRLELKGEVSKVSAELVTHKDNLDAHGAGARGRQGTSVLQVLQGLASLSAVGMSLFALLRKTP